MTFPVFWPPSWILAAILEVGQLSNIPWPASVSVTPETPELTSHLFISDMSRLIYDISCFLAAILDFGRHLESGLPKQHVMTSICFSDPGNTRIDPLFVHLRFLQADI